MKAGDKVWVLCEVVDFYKDWVCTYIDVTHDGALFRAKQSDCRPVERANSSEIPNSSSEPMRAAFEASLIQQMGWNQGYFGRNENRYFDSSVEMAWKAFQAGAKYGDPSGGWDPTKDEIEYAMDRCGVPASDPLAPSPCMDGVDVDQFIDGVMEARGRTSGLQVGDAVRFVWPGHKWHRTEGTIVSTTVDIKEYPYRFKSDCGAFERWCSVNQLERIDKADPVNPSHYKQGGIECIEAIKAATGDGFPDYLRGNVMKYLWRYKEKGGVDDLKKSAWYLDRLLKELGE